MPDERNCLIRRQEKPADRTVKFERDHATTVSMLDRLLHHAVVTVTEGESFRMREAKARGGGLPPTVRPRHEEVPAEH